MLLALENFTAIINSVSASVFLGAFPNSQQPQPGSHFITGGNESERVRNWAWVKYLNQKNGLGAAFEKLFKQIAVDEPLELKLMDRPHSLAERLLLRLRLGMRK